MNRFEEDDYEFAYEEDYTGRPVPFSDSRTGDTHHEECPSTADGPSWTCCKSLWERDYQRKQEEELEDLHQEYWQ